MTTQTSPAYQGVAAWLQDEGQHRRDMARAINQFLIGKLNVTHDVTLSPGATSTTISDARIGITTAIIPATALTASGATAISAGIWADTYLKGSVVLHHASNAAADQMRHTVDGRDDISFFDPSISRWTALNGLLKYRPIRHCHSETASKCRCHRPNLDANPSAFSRVGL